MTDRSLKTSVMFDYSLFRLLPALILSLLVHALILIGIASVFPAPLSVPVATIRVVFEASSSRATAAPEVKELAAVSVLPPMLAPKPVIKKRTVEKAPVIAAVPPSVEPIPLAPVVATAVLADAVVRSGSEKNNLSGKSPTLPNDGVNADDLRSYRISLASAARRFKHYPALARERGWEGATEIVLTIRAYLPEPVVLISRSSGHAVLDRQAVEMMAQAARLTVLPESLKGHDMRIVLPVQFSLDGVQ